MSLPRVVEFDGQPAGWKEWKMRFIAQMAILELEKEFTERGDKQAQAYNHLIVALTGSAIGAVQGVASGDAVAAWKALSDRFESSASARKGVLQEQLFAAKAQGRDVPSFLDEVDRLCAELEVVGLSIEDEVKMGIVSRGLPSSYRGLVQAFDARDEAPSWSVFVSRIRAEAVKQESEGRRDEPALAMGWRARGRGRGGAPDRGRGQFKGSCFVCGQVGHRAAQCSSRKRGVPAASVAIPEGYVLVPASSLQEPPAFRSDCMFAVDVPDTSQETWLVDSGAGRHLTPFAEDFVELGESKIGRVAPAFGKAATVAGSGTVEIVALDQQGREVSFRVTAHLVPGLRQRLFSVGVAHQDGHRVDLDNSLMRASNGAVLPLQRCGTTWLLHDFRCRVGAGACAAVSKDLLHARLGHFHDDGLRAAVAGGKVSGVDAVVGESGFCEVCAQAKSTREIQGQGPSERATGRGELIHADVWGPMRVESLGGKRFAVLFVDDFTRFKAIYFMRSKAEVVDKLRQYVLGELRPAGVIARRFHSDNGGEFVSAAVREFCVQQGIRQTFTTPHTPAQNGVAESSWRRLGEMARAMLLQSGSPTNLWAAAMDTACYLLNRLPTSANVAPVHKMAPRAVCGRFVGYCRESLSYLVLVAGRIVRSRSVRFDEDGLLRRREGGGVEEEKSRPTPQPPKKEEVADQEQHGQEENDDQEEQEDREEQEDQEEPDQEQADVRRNPARSTRGVPPERLIESCSVNVLACAVEICDEPKTYEEAMASPQAPQWKGAIGVEMDAHKEANTYTVMAKVPQGKTLTDSRWVLTVKRKADGTIERYKARWVARGFTQVEGIDYGETFAPVARYTTLRLFLAVAAAEDWDVEQSDVSTAFLNAAVDREVFVKPPPGSGIKGVCKLNRSLYGLKQSPRLWNSLIDAFLKELGFEQSSADPCLYVLSVPELVVVVLYVDDLVFGGPDASGVRKFKEALGKRFKVRHGGDVHYVLGVEVIRDRGARTLIIRQQHYLEGILRRFNMQHCKDVPTPVVPGNQLFKDGGEPLGQEAAATFRQLVGCLLYAAVCTRPDIAFAVGRVARFMAEPRHPHWQAAKRVVRYLSGTLKHGVVFGKDRVLIGHCDADFGGNPDNGRSTTGFVFALGGPVSWRSKLQPTVATSTVEAEYMALADAAKEAMFLRGLLADMQFPESAPTIIHGDNQGSLRLCDNPIFHEATKHIRLRQHFCREKVREGEIMVKYVPTKQMVADVLTKALGAQLFASFRDRLCSSQ